MTITTDFTGTENYAERMAGLEAIHDWWFGAGSFAAAVTLGQVRANLNSLLIGTTILNRETFAAWLSKINTLNEPTEYAAALTFGESQSGALWQCTVPSSLRAATDGTGDAAIGGSIARINDTSGNALHLTQASTSLRPIRGRRPKTGVRNLLEYTETIGGSGWGGADYTIVAVGDAVRIVPNVGTTSVQTQRVITRAITGPEVVSIRAKGYYLNLGLSGAGVWFDLVNGAVLFANGDFTGAISGPDSDGFYLCEARKASGASGGSVRLYPSITAPSSASATTGGGYDGTNGPLVKHPQREAGTVATAYQSVGATAHDITETGVESVSYAAFDLVDDVLSTGAIAGGLAGQAFVAGAGGCYVSDLAIVPGGAFSIGGMAHKWTGAAPGILRAVTGDTGRVLDAMIRAGAYTEDEIIRLERYYRALGGKGLLVPTGPNLVTGGDFSSETGWGMGAGWTISDGTAAFATTGTPSSLSRAIATSVGAWYFMEVDLLTASGEPGPVFVSYAVPPDGVSPALGTNPGHHQFVWQAKLTSTVVGLRGTTNTVSATFANLSVRRLIPREDL